MPYRFASRSLNSLALLTALICINTIQAADVPQGPAKEIPELHILNCYVGTWEVVAASNDAPNNPLHRGKATSKWILDGRFLEQTGALQALDGSNPMKVRTLMTYDVEQKTYRSWTFLSNGQATESVGKWDPANQTMTLISRPGPNGRITTTTANFAEAGIEKWKMSVADQAGKIVSQIIGKNTRQKE